MASAKKTVVPAVTKVVTVTPEKTVITLELNQEEADALFLVLGPVTGTSDGPWSVYEALENVVSLHDGGLVNRTCGNLVRFYNGHLRIDKK